MTAKLSDPTPPTKGKAIRVTRRKLRRLKNKKRKLEAYNNLVESNNEDRKANEEKLRKLLVKKIKKKGNGILTTNGTKPIKRKAEAINEDEEPGSLVTANSVPKSESTAEMKLKTPKKPRLVGEELAEMKRRRKELDKIKMSWPKIFLNNTGKMSQISRPAKERASLFMSDIQRLLLYALKPPGTQEHPRWSRLLRPNKISHTIAVFMDGVSIADFIKATELPSPSDENTACQKGDEDVKSSKKKTRGKKRKRAAVTSEEEDKCKKSKSSEGLDVNESLSDRIMRSMPKTSPRMCMKLELLAPSKYNSDSWNDLLNVPLSNIQQSWHRKHYKGLKQAAESGACYRAKTVAALFPIGKDDEAEKTLAAAADEDKFDRTSLLLSPEALIEFGYPVPVPGCPGYADNEFTFSRRTYSKVTPKSPMFGVDCEMCMTCIRKSELTSISIVNEKMELVYHTLVKPYNRIVNYVTEKSGITKEMLENVTKRLEDVQNDLRDLLPADAILVGHSLNCDFLAMKVMHPYVIDSSLVYNLSHRRGIRTGLKKLTSIFLKKEIQTADMNGHDPTEDAGASLALVQLKLRNDKKFGDVIEGYRMPDGMMSQQAKKVDIENDKRQTYETITYFTSTPMAYCRNFFEDIKQCQTAFLTTPGLMAKYSKKMPIIENCVDFSEVSVGVKSLFWRAAEVSPQMKFTYVHMKVPRSRIDASVTNESRKAYLQKLDNRLKKIYDCAELRSLLVFVFTGSSCKVPEDQRSNGLVMLDIKGADQRIPKPLLEEYELAKQI